MSRSWPTTPLAAAQRAFDLLTRPPAPLAFDGRAFPGLPARMLPLDELKTVLIDDATPRRVRDDVWRELVIRARRDGPAWVVAAVGIAMPGLRRAAGLLAKGWRGDSSDRDGELLAGFLARLHTVDLDDTRIVGKLIDAAARAVKHARERKEDTDVIRVDAAWSLPPQRPFDHPDWVLARAVAAAVIDPEEHLLIGATRLEEVPLQVVADKLGISVALAAAWRRKAERRLVGAVATGELDRVSLVEAAARRRSAAAAANRSAAAGNGRVTRNRPPAVRPDTMTTPRNAAPESRWRQRAVVAGAAR